MHQPFSPITITLPYNDFIKYQNFLASEEEYNKTNFDFWKKKEIDKYNYLLWLEKDKDAILKETKEEWLKKSLFDKIFG